MTHGDRSPTTIIRLCARRACRDTVDKSVHNLWKVRLEKHICDPLWP